MQYIYFFIVYTALNAVFYTANGIAYSSLVALMLPNFSTMPVTAKPIKMLVTTANIKRKEPSCTRSGQVGVSLCLFLLFAIPAGSTTMQYIYFFIVYTALAKDHIADAVQNLGSQHQRANDGAVQTQCSGQIKQYKVLSP